MAVQPSVGSNPIGIGSYSFDVGSGPDSFAEYQPKRERENAKALDAALDDEQAEKGDRPAPVAAIEEFQETADAVTAKIEKADALVQAASHGQLLDLSNLNGEINSLLDLFGRLDRAGRFEEELRLMRSLNGLLSLGLRWLDLIRSLRSLLRSAETAGHLAGQAFAHHELGTLHLCAGHPEQAAEHLREAARLQEQIGDVGVHCATRHNLDCARRDLALRGGLPRLLRLAGLVAVFAIIGGGAAGLASAISSHHHPVPPPPPPTAHLTVKPVGHGIVTGGGIGCSEQRTAHCTKEVASGSKVLLTATPAKGFVVAEWRGTSCGSGDNTCHVQVAGDIEVTVVFRSAPPKSATLKVVVEGSGTVAGAGIDCGDQCVSKVLSGSKVVLTATPADGYVVTDWKGTSCGRGNSTCSVQVDRDVTVTVVFASAPPQTATLTVVVQGSGSVTGGGIDCSDQSSAGCTTEVVPGSAVGLTATPAEGYVVSDWQGTSCGGSNICSVPVARDITVTVVFAPPQTATLTVVVQGSGKVTDGGAIDCAGTCSEPVTVGEQITLRAIAGAGTALGGWSDPTCTTDTCSLTIGGDTTLTVTFNSTLQ